MLGRSQGGRPPARYAWSGSHLRTRTILLAAMVATSGALVTTDGGALAATGGLTYRHSAVVPVPDVSVDTDGVTEGSVSCPSSHAHPTGGGVRIDGADPFLDLEVHGTVPGTLDRSWDAFANNNSGAEAQMTVFAICATGDYKYVHTTASVAAGHVRAAKVSCPSGTKVVGGGVEGIGGTHKVEVGASEPADGHDSNHKADDAWFGIVTNDTGSSLHMRVEAVCSAKGVYSVVAGHRTVLSDGNLATSVVLCPHGTRVTGGGTDIEGASPDLEVHDGFPIDGSDTDTTPDDGWQSTAYNDGSGSTTHMKTFAICKHV